MKKYEPAESNHSIGKNIKNKKSLIDDLNENILNTVEEEKMDEEMLK